MVLTTLTLGVLVTLTSGVLTTITGAEPAACAVDESPPQTSNDRIAVKIMLRFFIVYFWLELTSLDMALHGPKSSVTAPVAWSETVCAMQCAN